MFRLKWALIFSVALHLGFLAMRPLFGIGSVGQPAQSIEMTYVVPQEPSVPLKVKAAEPRPARVPVQEPPVLRVDRPAEPPPVRAPAPRTELPRPEPPRRVEPAPISPLAPEVLIPKGAAVNIPESAFALIDYKKLIRQHLKSRLVYPPAGVEGVVRVRMVLDGEGMLKQIAVMESSDPRLAEITVDGIRSAAPYPRFPKGMTDSSPRLEFLVQYRGDELDSS